MDTFQLKPLESVGGVSFGTKRDEVRAAFGGGYRAVKESFFKKSTSDEYDTFQVFYDKEDRMIAVEFFEGATVAVGETIVFPASADVAMRAIKGLRGNDSGLGSIESSVGIDCYDGQMVSLLAGEAGYLG